MEYGEKPNFQFSKEMEEKMLDLWWVINPDKYEEYWHKGIQGSRMLLDLAERDYKFFYGIYQHAQKTTRR